MCQIDVYYINNKQYHVQLSIVRGLFIKFSGGSRGSENFDTCHSVCEYMGLDECMYQGVLRCWKQASALTIVMYQNDKVQIALMLIAVRLFCSNNFF